MLWLGTEHEKEWSSLGEGGEGYAGRGTVPLITKWFIVQ